MGSHQLNRQRPYLLFGIGSALFVFFCLHLIPLPLSAAENPLQTILILHSYHRGYKWTDDQNAGIEATLKGTVNQNNIYIEYMEVGRMPHDKAFHDLYLSYKRKYRGLEFDVICVTDADALRFMLSYRDRLFPRASVVFSGISYISEAGVRNGQNFTGVSAEPDLKANIGLILKLHPRTKLVVFINEWTTKGQLLHEELPKKQAG